MEVKQVILNPQLLFHTNEKINTPSAANPENAVGLFAITWIAALLLVVLLGAADVEEAELVEEEGGAVPVGLEKPVTPPEKGPAGAEADAP